MFIHALWYTARALTSLITAALHWKSWVLKRNFREVGRRRVETHAGGERKVPVAFYSIIIIFHPIPHYGCWQRDFSFSLLPPFSPSLSLSLAVAFSRRRFFFWHKHTNPFCLMLQLLVAFSLTLFCNFFHWKMPSLITISGGRVCEFELLYLMKSSKKCFYS